MNINQQRELQFVKMHLNSNDKYVEFLRTGHIHEVAYKDLTPEPLRKVGLNGLLESYIMRDNEAVFRKVNKNHRLDYFDFCTEIRVFRNKIISAKKLNKETMENCAPYDSDNLNTKRFFETLNLIRMRAGIDDGVILNPRPFELQTFRLTQTRKFLNELKLRIEHDNFPQGMDKILNRANLFGYHYDDPRKKRMERCQDIVAFGQEWLSKRLKI